MKQLIWVLLLFFIPIGQPAGAKPLEAQGTNLHTKGDPSVKVWVDKHSHLYYCPGTHGYGDKQGEYMTQKKAQERHFRPAYGKVCEASAL